MSTVDHLTSPELENEHDWSAEHSAAVLLETVIMLSGFIGFVNCYICLLVLAYSFRKQRCFTFPT